MAGGIFFTIKRNVIITLYTKKIKPNKYSSLVLFFRSIQIIIATLRNWD